MVPQSCCSPSLAGNSGSHPDGLSDAVSFLRIRPRGRRKDQMDQLFRLSGAVRRDPAVDAWLAGPVRLDRELDAFLPEPRERLQAIARTWFEEMRRCGDDVRELIADGCPVACVGDAPFGYVNVFKAHVNVGFCVGATLDDPAGVLVGAG